MLPTPKFHDNSSSRSRMLSFRSPATLLSNWTNRLIGFCPLLLASPILAESFTLPICPTPERLPEGKSRLECDLQVKSNSTANPKTPQPKIGGKVNLEGYMIITILLPRYHDFPRPAPTTFQKPLQRVYAGSELICFYGNFLIFTT